MQNLIRMDMMVSRDDYHITTMDGNMNWTKPTLLFSIFLEYEGPPFEHVTLFPNFNSLLKCTH